MVAFRKGATEKSKKEKAPKVKKEKKTKKSVEVDFGAEASVAKKTPKGTPKPKVKANKDVYTLVLLLSFLFFIAATVFLYLDLATYK